MLWLRWGGPRNPSPRRDVTTAYRRALISGLRREFLQEIGSSEVMGLADWEVPVARLEGQVKTVQATLESHIEAEREKWADQEETNKEFRKKIDRPSWAITVILSALSSICVGLITYVATM